MGDRDERNRTEFGLKRDYRRIENRPGGTHPGAEQGAMCGSLMLSMVPGMFDRLRLSQSADEKDREHEEDRQEFEGAVVHRRTTQCNSAECYSMATGPVKTASTTGASAYYRIHGKDAVYCVEHFRRHRRSL